jgi:hypothetical protein
MSTVPLLERVRFFPGELLTAGDLTVAGANNRELLWLHNRALHDWGIGYGFDVKGERGDTSVTVSPGYATDAFGHELLLSAPVELPIPAVPGASDGSALVYYIVAQYVSDADEPTEEQRSATACASGGAVRLSNDPAIRWKTAAQLQHGVDVILGQVSIRNCALNAKVSTRGRRSAVPASRFSIFAAEIAASALTWQPWTAGATGAGFTAVIDTSVAHFQSTPSYMVSIVGRRSIPNTDFLILDFVSVARATPAGFTLQLALPAISAAVNPAEITDPFKGPALLKQLGWQIQWMGVEG